MILVHEIGSDCRVIRWLRSWLRSAWIMPLIDGHRRTDKKEAPGGPSSWGFSYYHAATLLRGLASKPVRISQKDFADRRLSHLAMPPLLLQAFDCSRVGRVSKHQARAAGGVAATVFATVCP